MRCTFLFKAFAIAMALSVLPVLAQAKTVCTVTLNSSDEAQTFAKHLKPQGFNVVELAPQTTSNSWFADACRSGVQCDVLVVSGHFGGLFFGEKVSNTLGLTQMEHASCDESCPGILKRPREVFLMGCNTLATQTPDHRTVDQYLDVLVNDGVPLSFAEQVAASRYSHQGFSLEERFSAVFDKSAKLYGFYSTGPLGAQAGGRLSHYLERENYNNHLNTLSSQHNYNLQQSFAGTSFHETQPSATLDATSRGLFCDLRNANPEVRGQAILTIVRAGLFTRYFDSIAELFETTVHNSIINWSADLKNILAQTFMRIRAANPNRLTLLNQVLNVEKGLGLISAQEKLYSVEDILSVGFDQYLNYQRISQISAIIAQEPQLPNPGFNELMTLSHKSPYFLLALPSYHSLNDDGRRFVYQKIQYPAATYEQTLTLEGMRKFWNKSDLSFLSSVWSSASPSLKRQMYLSAHSVLAPAGYRLQSNSPLDQCITKSDQSGNKDQSVNWSCLTENQGALTADVCDFFASQNPNDENSDDMRWYCWDHIPSLHVPENPECYVLADSMRVLGNRMKQVWNCSHRGGPF